MIFLAMGLMFIAFRFFSPPAAQACPWLCVENGGGGENCGCADNPALYYPSAPITNITIGYDEGAEPNLDAEQKILTNNAGDPYNAGKIPQNVVDAVRQGLETSGTSFTVSMTGDQVFGSPKDNFDFNTCPNAPDSSISSCATFQCPQGDTNNDGQCTHSDAGFSLVTGSGTDCQIPTGAGCWQVDYFRGGSSNNPDWNTYCGHLGRPDVNCTVSSGGGGGNEPDPTPTPRPSATPETYFCNSNCSSDSQCATSNSQLKCLNTDQGRRCRLPENPDSPLCRPPVGPQCLTISMNNISSQENPAVADPRLGDAISLTCGNVAGAARYVFRVIEPDQVVKTLQGTGRTSESYTIEKPGRFVAQCQICTGQDASSCFPFESVNTLPSPTPATSAQPNGTGGGGRPSVSPAPGNLPSNVQDLLNRYGDRLNSLMNDPRYQNLDQSSRDRINQLINGYTGTGETSQSSLPSSYDTLLQEYRSKMDNALTDSQYQRLSSDSQSEFNQYMTQYASGSTPERSIDSLSDDVKPLVSKYQYSFDSFRTDSRLTQTDGATRTSTQQYISDYPTSQTANSTRSTESQLPAGGQELLDQYRSEFSSILTDPAITQTAVSRPDQIDEVERYLKDTTSSTTSSYSSYYQR